MDTVYKELTDLFKLPETKARFTDNNLPAPRTIDINLGQPDNSQGFEIFYPAIFVSWEEAKPINNEPVLLTLNFHVIQEPGAGSEIYSARLDKGLEYIRVLKAIQRILTGFSASNTSKFIYGGKVPNITPFYRYHVLQYNCLIDEVGEEDKTTNVDLVDYNPTFNIKQKETPPDDTDIDVF